MTTLPGILAIMYKPLKENVALRTCVIYAIISSLWILFSDQWLFSFFTERGDAARFSMAKGVAFVLATSAIIYVLINRGVRAVRQSEESYRWLIETSPDAIALLDLDTRFIMVNRRALSFSGYDRAEDLIGKSILDFVASWDKARASAEVQTLLQTGVLRDSEYTAILKDRSFLPIELSASLVVNEERSPTTIMVIFRDIAERTRAEQALRDAEQKYRGIFEHAGEGIYQSTLEGRFVAANPMMARMLGYASPEELILSLTNIEEQLYVDRNARFEFKRRLGEQGSVETFESQLYRKDGRTIWV